MKISELLKILNEAMEQNGDMDISIIVDGDGESYDFIDVNYLDNESPLYIEGYNELPF